MQSANLEEIKAALWEQASHSCTRVSWGTAQVMAARSNKGQLLVLLRGISRWYEVSAVTIERPQVCPTGACDLEEVPVMGVEVQTPPRMADGLPILSVTFTDSS